MFKIYKKLKTPDWIAVIFIIGFTILQVYCTMTMVDYIQNMVSSISYLNYHNNPMLLAESGMITEAQLSAIFIDSGDLQTEWNTLIQMLASQGIENSTLSAIANASTRDIWFNGGMIILIALGSAACQLIVSVLASGVAANLATTLRQEINEKVSGFSLAEINKFSTASLVTRITNDVENVQMTTLLMMRMVFSAPITVIWALVKIQASSTQLTLATAVAIIILLIGIVTIMALTLPKFKTTQKLLDRVNGITQESLNGIRVVRAYNAENYQEEKFDETNKKLTKIQIFTGRVMGLMSPLMMLVMNGISLAIYWIGAVLINKGTIDYQTVVSFSTLASQIIMAFVMLLMMFIMWPRASICAKRINEVLETKSSVLDPKTPQNPDENLKGVVEFKNVSFKYPDAENNIINNISFKVNKGETIAFIGSTGSGKSTLVNLVTRLYDTTEGEIIIDGVNVKDLKQETLRSLIGFVPQKGLLFKGSIKYNVGFGKDNITDEECKEACEIACANEFIQNLDGKYDFEIAQGGTNVSGGQRQRLCIARAIATNPEILVFDDSFSALDYKTDLKVRENLKESKKDITKLIVAQRIGTIMDADHIVVLQNGEMIGYGKHKELLQNCEVYRDIALSQLTKEELGL